MSVAEATERAIGEARHLTEMDEGAVETLRTLARKIDTEARLREMALEWAKDNDAKPPHVDNVSIPTYLKFCESLGLTPAGRSKLLPEKEKAVGKLAALKSEVRKSA
jgi:hypothetical protein